MAIDAATVELNKRVAQKAKEEAVQRLVVCLLQNQFFS